MGIRSLSLGRLDLVDDGFSFFQIRSLYFLHLLINAIKSCFLYVKTKGTLIKMVIYFMYRILQCVIHVFNMFIKFIRFRYL